MLGASDLSSGGVELRRSRSGGLGVSGGDKRRPRYPRPGLGQEGRLASGRIGPAEVAGLAQARKGELEIEPRASHLPQGLQGGFFSGAKACGRVYGEVSYLASPPPAQSLDRLGEDEGVGVSGEGPSAIVAAGEGRRSVRELHQGGMDPLRQEYSFGEPRRTAAE